ncbi:MAG: 6-hydroxymethylpterin diphosphokinase MptE-like protein [Pseudomonadota bacterium]|nr:6-hydroxymethylpterin diphosphokinase MptE-like protein [Pseudomonadota bacterium]
MTTLLTAKQNAYGESYFEELNGKTFASSSSKTVFERYFKDAFEVEYQLYLVVGTDSGLLPRFLSDKYQDNRKGRKFVFIEQPQVMEQLDFSDLPDWMTVVSSEQNMKDLSADWIDYMMTKRLGLYKSIAIMDEHSEEAVDFWNEVKDQYSRLQFSDLANNHSRPFVEAQLKNYPRNNFPIRNFKERLKGKSAIVIGGGPSLDKLVGWIKENRDDFFIFAVGRVSKRLHKEGLVPDFIVSVDPHELSYDNSKQMFFFADHSILLSCFHMAPRLLSQWSGAASYFGELYPWEEASGNSTSPGPTVLHGALVQAAFLGCREIYLAGADLCFYEGKTHVSGSAEEEVGKLSIQNTSKVMTYSGDEAETDIPFAQGVVALGSVAKYLNETRDTQIYNLSPHAAQAEYVDYKSVDSVEIKPQIVSKTVVLEQFKSEIEMSSEQMLDLLKDKLSVMQKERKLMLSAQKLIKEAIKCVEKYQLDFNHKALSKAQNQRSKLDKLLDEKNRMLFYYGYNYFSKVMKPVEDNERLTDEEISHTLSTYFAGMKKSIRDYLKLLDGVINEIKFMQTEFKEDSLPCELYDRWEEKKEFGRSEVWQHYHETLTDQKQLSCLEKARDAFYIDISIEQTKQAARLLGKAFSVKNLIDKIKQAFESRSKEDLESLIKPVAKLKSQTDQQGLSNFIEGCMLAIDDPTSAIPVFEANTHPKLQVYIKNYLLSRYMESDKHEHALQALQDLCQLSSDYLIPYADYLNILGRPDLAAEVALELFKQEQTNLPALIKVVHYSHKAGLEELFVDALEVALSMDSQHPELLAYLNTNPS